MKIADWINTTEHRATMPPNSPWKFYQEWNKALFLHWKVKPEDLEHLVPKEMEIDLFEGQPWVSVVAFTMEKMRPKHLISLPPISNFDEINIRTYVNFKGKAGVYFLSIEGGTKLSCKLAAKISELPYRYSKMNRTENTFHSNNSEYKDELNIKYSIGKKLTSKAPIDKWLTERYALFQDSKNSINAYEIHHQEWAINQLNIEQLSLNYSRFKHLINNTPDKIHYSKGVRVVAWDKIKTKKANEQL